MRISILLLFGLAGAMLSCSTAPTKDGKLKPYINKFIEDMGFEKNRVKDYTVKFETLEWLGSRVIGKCNPFTNVVSIDPGYWYDLFRSEKHKTALVHHELGHCVCGIYTHVDDVMPDKCPVSIMNTSIPSNTCLQRHWDHYVEDLFQRCD